MENRHHQRSRLRLVSEGHGEPIAEHDVIISAKDRIVAFLLSRRGTNPSCVCYRNCQKRCDVPLAKQYLLRFFQSSLIMGLGQDETVGHQLRNFGRRASWKAGGSNIDCVSYESVGPKDATAQPR